METLTKIRNNFGPCDGLSRKRRWWKGEAFVDTLQRAAAAQFPVDPKERNYQAQITRIVLKRAITMDLASFLFPRVRRFLSPLGLSDEDLLDDMRATLTHARNWHQALELPL